MDYRGQADIRDTLQTWTKLNITNEDVAWIQGALEQPNDKYGLVAEVRQLNLTEPHCNHAP